MNTLYFSPNAKPYTQLCRFRLSTAIRYRTNTQREGGHQVPPHLAIHEGELRTAQPTAPHLPRERAVDAQRRRLLRV